MTAQHRLPRSGRHRHVSALPMWLPPLLAVALVAFIWLGVDTTFPPRLLPPLVGRPPAPVLSPGPPVVADPPSGALREASQPSPAATAYQPTPSGSSGTVTSTPSGTPSSGMPSSGTPSTSPPAVTEILPTVTPLPSLPVVLPPSNLCKRPKGTS